MDQAARGLAAPQLAFLHVAADALDWCGASRADPATLEAMRERFLPECAFGGRQNNKLGAVWEMACLMNRAVAG